MNFAGIFFVIILGLFATTSSEAEIRYFESDAGGFPINLLAGRPENAPEYLLEVETLPEKILKRLYKNGEEVESRIRITYFNPTLRQQSIIPNPTVNTDIATNKESDYRERAFHESIIRNSILVEESFFASDGAVLEEYIYASVDGSFVEKRHYAYKRNRLIEVRSYDGGDQELGHLVYRYDAYGRLAELEASGSFGEGGSGLVPAETGILAAWTSGAKQSDLVFTAYDDRGRPRIAEERKGRKLIRREIFSYAKSGRVASSINQDIETGIREERSYDEAGRAVLVVAAKDGVVISRIERSYDAENRIVTERLILGKDSFYRVMVYGESQEPIAEEERKNEVLAKFITRPSPKDRIEELFDGGLLFVRVYYFEGKKTKEEFISEGKVVRTRVFR